jgi:glycosyltransferase involved in cell wall biosynthesis
VVPEETGVLVAPGDVEALASAIAARLDDAGRRDAMGKAGRRRVERLFTVEAMMTRLVACYEAVVRERGARAKRAQA